MKQLPIRIRLTCWYFVMFAAAALLLSTANWWMLRRTMDATIHQDLQERADDVSKQIHRLGPDASVPVIQSQFDSVYLYRDEGKWLQIVRQDGVVLYRSAHMASLNPTLGSPALWPSHQAILDVSPGAHRLRILRSAIRVDNIVYFVDTGIYMDKPDALLTGFGLRLLLLAPLVLLLAAAGGHLMSRKALAPVALIAHEARRITDKNLDTRLPIPPGNDELSHLSITLNHMLARIDAAFTSVREFTANASHELRTPLARLRTEADIALMRPRNALEYRESLERIQQDAVDMSGLLDNLLTLARAEAGQEVLQLSPFNLVPLLQSVAKEWSTTAQHSGLRLQTIGFNVSSQADPVLILGDRLSLLQLIRILLDNACKYTPAGGKVTLRMIIREREVSLEVEDTGIGIAPEHQREIFNRFYRVHGDTGQQIAGAGLGLSLAAWIAAQHGAQISLDSTFGHGSRFHLNLKKIAADSTTVELNKPPTETNSRYAVLRRN